MSDISDWFQSLTWYILTLQMFLWFCYYFAMVCQHQHKRVVPFVQSSSIHSSRHSSIPMESCHLILFPVKQLLNFINKRLCEHLHTADDRLHCVLLTHTRVPSNIQETPKIMQISIVANRVVFCFSRGRICVLGDVGETCRLNWLICCSVIGSTCILFLCGTTSVTLTDCVKETSGNCASKEHFTDVLLSNLIWSFHRKITTLAIHPPQWHTRASSWCVIRGGGKKRRSVTNIAHHLLWTWQRSVQFPMACRSLRWWELNGC